jgi:AcrR family transcriptional regulator
VSVRDICRAAKANVAAVNYHFGSKLGLYTEVVDRAIATMQTTSDVTMHAEGSPADKLRHYVRTFLDRLVSPGRPAWIHRLVEHEMSQPTPAAGRIVERAIRPRIQYLTGIVSELLACAADDPRVRRSVVSLQGQCLFHARLLQAADPFREIGFPQWPRDTTLELEAVADHVAEFSLAGIRGIGGVDGEP